MSIYVFDLEANGLLPDASKIWCGVFKDVMTGGATFCMNEQDVKSWMEDPPFAPTVLIGHNICDYDIPLMEKILGVKYTGKVYDTYLMSLMRFPDKKKHPDLKGKKTAHSLENYGLEFGRHKPEHEDWSQFTPEMLHRCEEDVEITYLTWLHLSKEMGICLR